MVHTPECTLDSPAELSQQQSPGCPTLMGSDSRAEALAAAFFSKAPLEILMWRQLRTMASKGNGACTTLWGQQGRRGKLRDHAPLCRQNEEQKQGVEGRWAALGRKRSWSLQ